MGPSHFHSCSKEPAWSLQTSISTMNNPDSDWSSFHPRLYLSVEDFDNYLITLTTKLHLDSNADRILSGELCHPFIGFQQRKFQQIAALNVPYVSTQVLLLDPVTPYINWIHVLTDSLLRVPAPVPAVEGLQQLRTAQDEYRRVERFIYSTIVSTLKVGETIHYVRQTVFGVGQILL